MNIDPTELEMGIAVEKDHADDKTKMCSKDSDLAKAIALRHLKDDPRYYTKLKAAGLEEEGALTPLEAGMAEQGAVPSVAIVTIEAPSASQKGLSSSNLGSGVPKKLSTTNLEAPETKVVNDKNTVSYGKTPTIGNNSDPVDHFCGLAVDETRKSNYDGDGNIKMS